MTIRFKDYRQELLSDPDVKVEYDALEDEYAIARAIIEARVNSGLTQEELARRMGTTQSVVARWESGKTLPSCRTLCRIAKATGTHFRPQFVTR